MKKEVKKKMTLDGLAVLIAGSFSGFEERLTKKIDGVESRLGGVESRLGGVESRLGGVESRLGGVEKELEGVKNRLEGTNKRLDDLAETKASKITYKEIENRVGFIEKKLEIK
ncbi:hypothetical protein A2643_02545 [Candidatus Nomurabacteria bacterium RIFCSPHIGHO2_01_FULL_39_220]|uniref:Uncharacterized protein n=1 Tax=Candidatus Nomurabacteria bacterium RIFCSPLOWO2_02_FULL_40_67 TaxID=1801787 RepID=A0A1F6Y2Z2_9BACT|nr:MAG: hypothetical protein A2643_02545 [Candidatus Nomurabacteria bacterium RIFCSPHIGHO2_01_FULL_39_220]OGI73389.1 MAG: hypothetical protein A2W56_00345 [Candidatus Nomurabacteria bacterium RIFCSPHIGHO2_02_41_18]OGI78172.1 MAG: hypothetical protein A3C65_00195 [Candidatus Nomurabacteria bacterium RIFCSPHIGHO2_02_FULL_41_150]OGI81107.1 MAG: hypothetical protein A3E03_00435 [Candidatus Nomurabacteria bacterium RIFCSPHIGHO2_12_FULL_40_64]OGI90980.1 MAG: hypothetical protein A3A06_03360 [Candidat